MSTAMESFPVDNNSRPPAASTLLKRSVWRRMLWKDSREIVPIWITMLSAAVLCLLVTLWMVNGNTRHVAPLYISGHTFIALISIITGVYLWASEDENRTISLLRNLPLSPKQIVWQKLLLGSLGVVAMAVLIALFATLLAEFSNCHPLVKGSSYGFTIANVVLLPLMYLTIAALSSTISRSYFYGMLIAGGICAAAIAVLEPSWLGSSESWILNRNHSRWFWVALGVAGGVGALVFGANRWAEERVVGKSLSTVGQAKLNSAAQSSIPISPNPLPALMWQSLRQSRVLMACCFVLTIVGWLVIPPWISQTVGNAVSIRDMVSVCTLLWALGVMVLFASSIFLDDKRQDNYLFFQQNRERSKWLWLSRLVPFWSLALLIALLWHCFIFNLIDPPTLDIHAYQQDSRSVMLYNSVRLQAALQSFLVPLLGLLGIIGIGQYFSMFFRNPILSFIFAGIICLLFAFLLFYVVFINENVWLYVVPTIAASYFATWWRAKTWLATSPHRRWYVVPLLLPVVAFGILSVHFIHHRATEFSDVEVNTTNVAQWAPAVFDYLGHQGLGLPTIEFGTQAQGEQAASLYRDAIKLAGEDLTDPTENKSAIAKIKQAAQIPVCAPIFADLDSTRNGANVLLEICMADCHLHLLNGNLAEAKESIDAYDRLRQRSGTHLSRFGSGYYGTLIKWADHPKQKLSELKLAIHQLEGSKSNVRPTKVSNSMNQNITADENVAHSLSIFYQELGGEKAFMDLQYLLAELRAGSSNGTSSFMLPPHIFPWEHQRFLKVSQIREVERYREKVATIVFQQPPKDLPVNLKNQRAMMNIPIDENRISIRHLDFDLFREYSINGAVHWRRYTLIRLGLALYHLEHDEYPDDLNQLEPYYQDYLPRTLDGLKFGWFKSGLEVDLIDAYAYQEDGKRTPSNLIAKSGTPLLLPFAVKTTKELLQQDRHLQHEKGKNGIDIKSLKSHRNKTPFRDYLRSRHETSWAVGAKK